MNYKKGLIILTIVLFFISSFYLLIRGQTYTFEYKLREQIGDIEDTELKNNVNNIYFEDLTLNIEQDKEIIKCIDIKIEDEVVILKFKSVNSGKAIVNIQKGELGYSTLFYVNKLGIITHDSFLGNCNGGKIIPISLAIELGFIIFIYINKVKEGYRQNIYQYKNIAYLGLIFFLGFIFINQIFNIFSQYNGLIYIISYALSYGTSFSIYVLPITFLTFIFVTISNFVLIKKEGMNWRNLLGCILGMFLCIIALIPGVLNYILQTTTIIDVHNQRQIWLYLERFVESEISVIGAYLECILIGTIILSIKAAKHIPKFNKDYIIILGAKMKKDGTLTNLLKERVDRAISFGKLQKEKTGKDIIYVPSGGKGKDEPIAEAIAMKNYLIKNGVEEKNILIEDKSTNSYQNIKFSNEKIIEQGKNAEIAFSTTNYHVFRAGIIASRQNLKFEGIGAKTKTYFWINAFVREFIATLFIEKKKHFIFFSIITIIVIIMVILEYAIIMI